MKKLRDTWTGWMPVDPTEFEFSEDGRTMPVPPWMEVRVLSVLGEHDTAEQARCFDWDDNHGVYNLMFYRVTLQ